MVSQTGLSTHSFLCHIENVQSVHVNSTTASVMIRYEGRLTHTSPLLAALQLRTVTLPPPNAIPRHLKNPPARRLSSKMAEAAAWCVLETAVERAVPLLLAALI